MTVKLAPMPIYCAGCHGQNPELRHVDFDSALDRGYGKPETVQITYDEAVFCENCVKPGAELLGMIDGPAWEREKANLEKRVEVAESRVRQVERYSASLEDLALQRGVKIDQRRKPREREPIG